MGANASTPLITDGTEQCVMADETTLTTSDQGKEVVTNDNEVIGTVTEVEGNRAYVEPDPDVTDAVMSRLGWGSRDQSSFQIESEQIDAIVQDQIRLKSM